MMHRSASLLAGVQACFFDAVGKARPEDVQQLAYSKIMLGSGVSSGGLQSKREIVPRIPWFLDPSLIISAPRQGGRAASIGHPAGKLAESPEWPIRARRVPVLSAAI